MPWLSNGKNGSVVYFEQSIDLLRAEPFIAAFNERHPQTRITLFHLVVWAMARTLGERPRLNRFVAGGRIWERDGIWISYSAKKRLDDDAPIVVLKRRFDPSEGFEAMVASMYGELARGRSDEKSSTDKEIGLIASLPTPLVSLLFALARGLDRWGLLPGWFIRDDPMFASVFVANLGSLKMDAGYHHLYEYGSIPIFCVIGRTREVPVVKGGQVVPSRAAILRYTYDERIEDGLYAQRALERLRELVEDPGAVLAP